MLIRTEKLHFQETENYFPECTVTPDFICASNQVVLGLSKEVHNSFLAQRT